MQITMYTDGACDIHAVNRPGGWAAIICATDERGNVLKETVISGGQQMTTNNQMELTAVIEGLKQLQSAADITIVTDSKYVMDIATGKKRAAKNRGLWREYFEVAAMHKVKWQYVAGHSGNAYNERCDRLAVIERQKYARGTVKTAKTSEPDTTVYLASKHSPKQNKTAWSAYILRGGEGEIVGAALNDATYYKALLIGAIQTLKKLPSDERAVIRIAQPNIVTGINKRIHYWMQNDWTYRRKVGNEVKVESVKYKQHWQELLQLKQARRVTFEYDKSLRHNPLYESARGIAESLLKIANKPACVIFNGQVKILEQE